MSDPPIPSPGPVTEEGVQLQRADGPENPIAALPRRGVGAERPWRYRRTASGVAGEHRRPIEAPGIPLGTLIVEDSSLHYFALPEHRPEVDDIRDSFAATGIAIDLLLDDGTRLSEAGIRDQYGVEVTAEGRYRAKVLIVEQWNLTRIDLGPLAGRRIVAVELVLHEPAAHAADLEGRQLQGWLDGIALHRGEPEARRRPSDWVRTTRGTNSSYLYSRGNTVPAVGLPHAFATLTPVTRAAEKHWLYFWQNHNDEANRPVIQAFATSRIPSPWIGERGAFQFMPMIAAGRPDPDRTARQLAFRHEDEIDRAHYYRVAFENGVEVELAPEMHAGIIRIRFPEEAVTADAAVLLVDQVDGEGGLRFIEEDGRLVIAAHSDARPERVPVSPRAFLVAELDRPVLEHGILDTPDRSGVCGFVRVALGEDRTVTLRLATSFLGRADARRHLDREIPAGSTLDEVAERAAERWDGMLGRVQLEGASDDRLTTLYSNLYRLFLFPSVADEPTAAGERVAASPFLPLRHPHSETETGCEILPGALSANNGFWDTYRTAWPALQLLDPAAGSLLDGFLAHYRQGGWMSRWTAPGYVDVMVGTSSDVILADAAVKGVAGVDIEEGYDSALRNATVPSPETITGRKGLERSAYLGFTPTEVEEGLSWTMEGAVNDAGLAALAALLGEQEAEPRRRERFVAEAEYFQRRAAASALLFDEESGFFRGRDAAGRFAEEATDYDPRVWGGDYTETNGWGMAFTLPHDGAGLAALLGGRTALEAKLDRFFSEEESETGREAYRGPYSYQIHEISEAKDIRLGMFAPSNQPAHHIASMYLAAGAPHKAQRIIRECLERLFLGNELGQGYPGDEDNGEMSAWWLFHALGIYPLRVGTPFYALGAPLFPEARVQLAGGAQLRVTAEPCGPQDRYIQSLRINGTEWTSTEVPHALLAAGAHLEFQLGPEPSSWGTAAEDAPGSLTRAGERPAPLRDRTRMRGSRLLASAGVAHPDAAVDDDSRSGVLLDGGEWIGVELPEPVTMVLYTVTPAPGVEEAEVAEQSWVLEFSQDGLDWREADRQEGAEFRWPRQLRPFRIPGRITARWWRLRAIEQSLALAEWELFDASGAPERR